MYFKRLLFLFYDLKSSRYFWNTRRWCTRPFSKLTSILRRVFSHLAVSESKISEQPGKGVIYFSHLSRCWTSLKGRSSLEWDSWGLSFNDCSGGLYSPAIDSIRTGRSQRGTTFPFGILVALSSTSVFENKVQISLLRMTFFFLLPRFLHTNVIYISKCYSSLIVGFVNYRLWMLAFKARSSLSHLLRSFVKIMINWTSSHLLWV